MIAAFRVLLPFNLYVPTGEKLSWLLLKVQNLDCKIYPPYQADIDYRDFSQESSESIEVLLSRLKAVRDPQPSQNIRINDKTTAKANVLHIDFHKDDFNRNIPEEGELPIYDPPLETAFSVTNKILTLLRTILKASSIKPIMPHSVLWRMDYFNDDGSDLAIEEDKLRGHFATRFKWQIIGITDTIWTSIKQLSPEYSPPIWETLLLDAYSLLPELGPALVLAYSTIETLVTAVANQLANNDRKLSDWWKWLNSRNNYWQEPSIADKADTLLKVLSGKSLKSNAQLWGVFQEIRKARNSFVHNGILKIGKNEVTFDKAMQLLAKTRDIISWFESNLSLETISYKPDQKIEIVVSRRI